MNEIAEKLQQLTVKDAEVKNTSLPPEIIHYILSFLNPTETTTVGTLLACQLVSHIFAELARSSDLWRPIVLARRSTCTAQYPPLPLPLSSEDQATLDGLFPPPLRPPLGTESAFKVFRARRLFDRLAVEHLGDFRAGGEAVCLALWDQVEEVRREWMRGGGTAKEDKRRWDRLCQLQSLVLAEGV